jgi:hypothetical protein
LFSCNPSFIRPIVYEPKETESVFSFYVNGNPVAAVISNSSAFQSSIEFNKLSQRHYLRVWVNFTNLSSKPVLLEPMNSFKLTQYKLIEKTKLELIPEYPSKIVQMIQSDKQSALLVNSFLGIIESVSTSATTYYSSTGENIQVNDLQEKLKIVAENTGIRSENISRNFDQFINNLDTFFLKKNTVFPNQSVSGFIYFELEKGKNIEYQADEFAYILKSDFADINNSIHFLPVKAD